jgi:hypothetical protein
MTGSAYLYENDCRALLYYKKRDGSFLIVPVTVVRPVEQQNISARRYLIRSDNGGYLTMDEKDLRPATALDLMVLELDKSDNDSMT